MAKLLVWESSGFGSNSENTRLSMLFRMCATIVLDYRDVHVNYSQASISVHQCPFTPFFSASETFFGKDGGRIGGQYLKVMYKEYTDGSFTTTKPQTPESQHLALFGMDWNLHLL